MTRITLLLFVALNLLNYLDRYLVPALLPLISLEFNLNYEQSGILVSSFVFGYFLTSPLFGYLGDRLHRPALMMFGVCLWSIATFATGLAQTFAIFFAVRVFVGIGEASFGTIAPGYFKDRNPDPITLNKAFSWFYAAIPVGSALAYVLSGIIVEHFTWHSAFFLAGVPGVILSLLLLKLPEAGIRGGREHLKVKEGLRNIFSSPVLLFAIVGYVFNAFALNGIAAFITHYGALIGFQVDRIQYLFGIVLVLTGFIGTTGGGWLVNHLVKKSKNQIHTMLLFVAIGAALGVPFIIAAFLSSNHALFIALCFVSELLIFSGVAPINSVIVLSSPSQYVTLSQGVSIFLMNLFGALLSPWLIGRVADATSLPLAMQLTSVGLAGSALFWYLGARYAQKVGVRDPA